MHAPAVFIIAAVLEVEAEALAGSLQDELGLETVVNPKSLEPEDRNEDTEVVEVDN